MTGKTNTRRASCCTGLKLRWKASSSFLIVQNMFVFTLSNSEYFGGYAPGLCMFMLFLDHFGPNITNLRQKASTGMKRKINWEEQGVDFGSFAQPSATGPMPSALKLVEPAGQPVEDVSSKAAGSAGRAGAKQAAAQPAIGGKYGGW